MSIILPDDIKDLSRSDLAEKVNEIYKWLVSAREQINFWGSNRNKDIFTLQEAVATRSVKEAGNNYMKVGDGTMIQWGQETAAVAVVNNWDGWYWGQFPNFSFPFVYKDIPAISVMRSSENSGIVEAAATETGIKNIYIYRPISLPENTYTISWIAIGRWK